MPGNWRSIVLIFFLFSIRAFAGEAEHVCHPKRFSLTDANATYAYGQDYEQYEYSFEYEDNYWTAVVYRFHKIPSENQIIRKVYLEDDEGLQLEKVFLNASGVMLKKSIVDSVSKPRVHETQFGKVLAFSAESVVGIQHHSFVVQRRKTEVWVYRTFSISDRRKEDVVLDGVMLKIMESLIDSCKSIVQ